MNTPPATSVVLIEPNAHRSAGHWHHALTALSAAGTPVLVVTLNGIAPATRAAVTAAGGRIVVAPPAGCRVARVLLAAGRVTEAAARQAVGVTRRHPGWPRWLRRAPHQVTMVSRCLIEAASLRTGRALAPGAAQIILTASETLHALAASWGGAEHLRFVHEVFTTEDAALRVLARTTRRHRRRVLVVCPTEGVREAVAGRFGDLATTVMPFAIRSPADYLTEVERAQARAMLAARGVADGVPVAVLVGGWWPSKDIATVIEAFTRLTTRWHLIVAGRPITHRLLQPLTDRAGISLQVQVRDLAPEQLRRLYAAADITIVSRAAGATKESGLVMDAVRHGVPLVCSDHDPHLTARLRAQPWARMFRTGDPAALAAALTEAAARRLDRPRPGDAARLGLATGQETLARLVALHARLPHHNRTWP